MYKDGQSSTQKGIQTPQDALTNDEEFDQNLPHCDSAVVKGNDELQVDSDQNIDYEMVNKTNILAPQSSNDATSKRGSSTAH